MSGWSSVMKQTTVLFLVLAIGLALVLFTVKYQVQALDVELRQTNKGISEQREQIQILNAEFSYLTQPERLRGLANRHLGLGPVAPGQLATFDGVKERLRHQPEEDAAVSAARRPVLQANNNTRRAP